MQKALYGILFCLAAVPAVAKTAGVDCASFRPDRDPKRWTWLDRDCKMHSRKDLDLILERHSQWLRKYSKEIQDYLTGKTHRLPDEVSQDSLRANLWGATLIRAPLDHVDLTEAIFEQADLTGAQLQRADLTGVDFKHADLSGVVAWNAILIKSMLEDATLIGAWLNDADLTEVWAMGADLTSVTAPNADLSGASLPKADLTRAVLVGATLIGTHFENADLTGAFIWSGADMTHASFDHASLRGASLFGADLSQAYLNGSDLTGAKCQSAILTGTDLTGADLSGADFSGADLSEAVLGGTGLSGADFAQAKLLDVVFEPKSLPTLSTIARAEGLRTLRWRDGLKLGGKLIPTEPPTPRALWLRFRGRLEYSHRSSVQPRSYVSVQSTQTAQRAKTNSQSPGGKAGQRVAAGTAEALRSVEIPSVRQPAYAVRDLIKAFHDAGYREAEAEVNLAYHRRIESWWEIPLFDWTCEWGANWARPIWIVLALGGMLSFVYWSLLRFGRNHWHSAQPEAANITSRIGRRKLRRQSHLYVVARCYGRERLWPVGRNFAPPALLARPNLMYGPLNSSKQFIRALFLRLVWEFPLLWNAALFSVMSILNLGVQGLDLGRWIRLIQRREFDLKARGSIRLIAGIQSVASFLLLALAAYVLIVHPLDE